jgi:hypothetical protein
MAWIDPRSPKWRCKPDTGCESVIVRDPLFPSSSVLREKKMQSRVGQGPAGVLLLRRPFLAPSLPSWLQRAAD